MRLFCDTLHDGLAARGVAVERLLPEPRLGRWRARGELAKWLGHADKFILFPRTLRKNIARLRAAHGDHLLVHICDHSNAMYAREARGVRHLVTCHDLMAVRLALGDLAGPPVRYTGRRLQGMIRRGLEEARYVACITECTRADLHRVCRRSPERSSVILFQLNHPYARLAAGAARVALSGLLPDDGRPLVLHVGNNSWYKNRDGVLRIFHAATALGDGASSPRPRLVIVGHEMRADQDAFIAARGLRQDVRWLPAQPPAVLQAMYSVADVFLFPSLYEGFGWPPIEAQACGCPVVCTREGGLAEAAEDSALTAPAADEAALSAHVHSALTRPELRAELVAKGRANVHRFEPPRMIDDYQALYTRLLAAPFSP
jgi:glycosyltransferase involved in cell wall biosynthesis